MDTNSVGQLARTYFHQLCADTGFSLEDLPGVMNGCRDRLRDIHTVITT